MLVKNLLEFHRIVHLQYKYCFFLYDFQNQKHCLVSNYFQQKRYHHVYIRYSNLVCLPLPMSYQKTSMLYQNIRHYLDKADLLQDYS